jgi:hypothetical protein
VFQDEFAYATQYFSAHTMRNEQPPLLIDPKFDQFCRVCRMGTSDIPYGDYDGFVLLANAFNPFSSLPADFRLVKQTNISLRPLDRFQLRYFTAVYNYRYYMLYVFERQHHAANAGSQ